MSSFEVISPINQRVYCQRDYATTSQWQQQLQQAVRMQKEWCHTSLAERAAVAEQVVVYFEQHKNRIAEEIAWQMGRPVHQALGEIAGLAERARSMIAQAESALAPMAVQQALSGFSRYIQREPLGVVLVLAPWNYPYLTAVNSIIPAIMAGNTVILKHAQQTPLCAERFAAAFAAAGAPEGVFQYCHLDHAQVGQVIQQPSVAAVVFTGSVAGGLCVQQAAANRFIPVSLELGGKDPAYVRADAALDQTVEALIDGAFYNSGQSCCGVERIYVHQTLFDEFVERFVEGVKLYRLGDPREPTTTLGPMVSPAAVQQVVAQMEQAMAAGAQPLLPRVADHPTGERAAYLTPQVLVNVDHRMAIMREETFGPAVGIMPVEHDAAAMAYMNDSDFGLTASIWTEDQAAAVAIGQQVETGTVFMNRCDYLDPELVWTGVKASGRGYSLSALGYHQLTRAKSFHLKHHRVDASACVSSQQDKGAMAE